MPRFYEFFAGGGMARAGFGPGWSCAFANDFDPRKAKSYALNWGADHLHVGDVARVTMDDLPGQADLAWASFPCQDLSLAGVGAGLNGERSGTFWPFWSLMKGLHSEGRGPKLIVLENVCGALTSHGGRDFAAIADALAAGGYKFGALVIDAAQFLPQSRPRLFIIGVRNDLMIPPGLAAVGPDASWHSPALIEAQATLSTRTRKAWLWWRLPAPPIRNAQLADMIETRPTGVAWHAPAETRKLLAMMSPLNFAKVTAAKARGRSVGCVYRRTRPAADGGKVQRAEVRFDGLAGCLRTPAGGSSRQTVLIVEGERIRSRLLSPREAARLMGLPEEYRLPENYNEAYHLAGDGVAVPVVRYLAAHLLEPILGLARAPGREAA